MPSRSESNTPVGKNPVNYILIGVLVVAAFVIGSLYQKVKYLEKGVGNNTNVATQQGAAAQQAQAEPTVTIDSVRSAFGKSAIKFGDSKNKLVFIEVADPSCPYCHIAAGKNAQLNKEAGAQFTLVSDGGTYVAPVVEMKKLVDSGKAAFAWLYTNGHGNGEMGTKALYCANEKGKFWEVHDLIMNNEGYKLLNDTVRNDKTKTDDLVKFLAPAINSTDLKNCLESGKFDNRLAEDTTIAGGLGVSGTPGFFVNGTKFAGAYSYKDMESAVNSALK